MDRTRWDCLRLDRVCSTVTYDLEFHAPLLTSYVAVMGILKKAGLTETVMADASIPHLRADSGDAGRITVIINAVSPATRYISNLIHASMFSFLHVCLCHSE